MGTSWKQDVGLLALRLCFGGFMAATHGLDKVLGFSQMAPHFPAIIGSSSVSLGLAAAAEFGAASFVVLGLLTRLACLPLIATMAMAAFVVHAADPFAKKEMALLYLSAYICIFLLGPGRFALDRMLPDFLKK